MFRHFTLRFCGFPFVEIKDVSGAGPKERRRGNEGGLAQEKGKEFPLYDSRKLR
jgi:hypothetical protein